MSLRMTRILACIMLACLWAAAPALADEQWLIASDIHLNPFDTSPLPAYYEKDGNIALLDSTIAAMRRVEPNPPVILLTGDFLAHHFPQLAKEHHQTPAAAAIATMRLIAQRFDKAFPHARFIVVVGNNDDPCGDYVTTYDSAYSHALAKVWAPLVDRNGVAPDFSANFGRGAYYLERYGSLRIVALNSVYWSLQYFNVCAKQSLHRSDPAARNPGAAELAWLERTLSNTPRGDANLVVMHIPVGIDPTATVVVHGVAALPFLNWPANAKIESLLADPTHRVAAVIAGHLHHTEFRAIGEVPLLIVPAISPIYGNSPTFFKLDIARAASAQALQQFTIRDFSAYMYRYTDTNAPLELRDKISGKWQLTYDYNAAFGVSGFTGAAVQTIHDRLRSGWRPEPATEFEASRYVVCAQIELGNYSACSPVRRHQWLIAGVIAMVVVVVLAGYAIIRWL